MLLSTVSVNNKLHCWLVHSVILIFSVAPPKTTGLKKQSSYSLNEEAKFHCRARGNPVPIITWKYLDKYQNVVPTEFNQVTGAIIRK